MDITMNTPMSASYHGRISFPIILLLLAAAHGMLRAQPLLDTTGRLQAIDSRYERIPDGGERSLTGLFFRDSLNGFVASGSAGVASFATKDGGITWSRLASPVPIPHRVNA